MPAIHLYTLTDAREDAKVGYSPAKSSIMKWISIVSALEQVRSVIGTYCGLCLEYSKCTGCPLVSCTKIDSPYENAYTATSEALNQAREMLEYIREKTEDKK